MSNGFLIVCGEVTTVVFKLPSCCQPILFIKYSQMEVLRKMIRQLDDTVISNCYKSSQAPPHKSCVYVETEWQQMFLWAGTWSRRTGRRVYSDRQVYASYFRISDFISQVSATNFHHLLQSWLYKITYSVLKA